MGNWKSYFRFRQGLVASFGFLWIGHSGRRLSISTICFSNRHVLDHPDDPKVQWLEPYRLPLFPPGVARLIWQTCCLLANKHCLLPFLPAISRAGTIWVALPGCAYTRWPVTRNNNVYRERFISKLLFDLRCLCVFPSFCPSVCPKKKNFLMVAHIKKCQFKKLSHF